MRKFRARAWSGSLPVDAGRHTNQQDNIQTYTHTHIHTYIHAESTTTHILTRPGRLRARSGSRLPTARFRSGPRWERCKLKGRAPAFEVSSKYCADFPRKGFLEIVIGRWCRIVGVSPKQVPKSMQKRSKINPKSRFRRGCVSGAFLEP